MNKSERKPLMIPSKVKIGGHTYNVKYPHMFQERFDHSGQIDHSQCCVFIADSDISGKKPRSVIYETFIHELLHALNYRAGDVLFSKDTEVMEGQVSALSEGILALLVDNGWLDIESV